MFNRTFTQTNTLVQMICFASIYKKQNDTIIHILENVKNSISDENTNADLVSCIKISSR